MVFILILIWVSRCLVKSFWNFNIRIDFSLIVVCDYGILGIVVIIGIYFGCDGCCIIVVVLLFVSNSYELFRYIGFGGRVWLWEVIVFWNKCEKR